MRVKVELGRIAFVCMLSFLSVFVSLPFVVVFFPFFILFCLKSPACFLYFELINTFIIKKISALNGARTIESKYHYSKISRSYYIKTHFS